jgi:hypothetical protein
MAKYPKWNTMPIGAIYKTLHRLREKHPKNQELYRRYGTLKIKRIKEATAHLVMPDWSEIDFPPVLLKRQLTECYG